MKTLKSLNVLATLILILILAACNGEPLDMTSGGATPAPVAQRDPTPADLNMGCFVDADCDDGDPCATEFCHGGTCKSTDQIICPFGQECWMGKCGAFEKECENVDDDDPCTIDKCDELTGEVRHYTYSCPMPEDLDPRLFEAVCSSHQGERICTIVPIPLCDADDDDPCTQDACDANGEAIHWPRCDDGNPRTDDECDPDTGDCNHFAVPPECLNNCASSNPCFVSECNWETEACELKPLCDPQTMWCDSGICRPLCDDNAQCFDNNPCTIDSCGEDHHCYNGPRSCDDNDDGTFDSCDQTVPDGCVHVEYIQGADQCAGMDNDNDPCTVPQIINGTCVEINPCSSGTVCQPVNGLAVCVAAATPTPECVEGSVQCYEFWNLDEFNLVRCIGGLWVTQVNCGALSNNNVKCIAGSGLGCSTDQGDTWFGWNDAIN